MENSGVIEDKTSGRGFAGKREKRRPTFEVGSNGALKIGGEKPVCEGYSRLGMPQMHYHVGETRVSQTVTLHVGLVGGVLKRGLQYTFKVDNAKGKVALNLNPAQVLAESSAGKWSSEKTVLSLKPEEAGEFTVTLLPKN